MRKRRWWFAGLALALLAACVGVWKLSERPPLILLRDHPLYMVLSDNQTSWLIYMLDEPEDAIYRAAAAEVGTTDHPSGMYREFEMSPGVYLWIDGADVHRDNLKSGGGDFPPIPKTAQTCVWIERPSSPLDRMRGWLYSLRWKGGAW